VPCAISGSATIGFSGTISGVSAHLIAGSSQLMHWRSVRPDRVTTGTRCFPHLGQCVIRSMRSLPIFHAPTRDDGFRSIRAFLAKGGPSAELNRTRALRRILAPSVTKSDVLPPVCWGSTRDPISASIARHSVHRISVPHMPETYIFDDAGRHRSRTRGRGLACVSMRRVQTPACDTCGQ
jgi:hypothetical protein